MNNVADPAEVLLVVKTMEDKSAAVSVVAAADAADDIEQENEQVSSKRDPSSCAEILEEAASK